MTKKYLNTPEEVINALKEGKVIKDRFAESYRLQDGFIVSITKQGSFVVGTAIHGNCFPYIEEQEPLKLEVGKFYKTRGGRKAFIFAETKNSGHLFSIGIFGHPHSFQVFSDGLLWENEQNDIDLVAPWED